MEDSLREQMLAAWVGVNCMIKNTRLTKGLTYNEAILMMFIYQRYREDPKGKISVGELIQKTNMLKSLVNRTTQMLIQKGYIEKIKGEQDGRTAWLRLSPQRLEDFMRLHGRSLQIVDQVLDLIGSEDARAFIRIYERLSSAGPKFISLNEKEDQTL